MSDWLLSRIDILRLRTARPTHLLFSAPVHVKKPTLGKYLKTFRLPDLAAFKERAMHQERLLHPLRT